MDKGTSTQLRRLIPSALLLVAEIVVAVVLSLTLTPSRKGFVVYDATLNGTYQPDSSIPFWVAIVVPLVSLLLSIILRHRHHLRGVTGDAPWILFFATAGVTTAIVTEVFKNVVGRYRPDWLARCVPSDVGVVSIDAFGATGADNPACTNNAISESKLEDGHKSFPSGHSSTAFSLGTVVVFYACWWISESRGKTPTMMTAWRRAVLEVWSALQIAWAFAVASSRVIDNKHHVSDVAAGGLIGTCFGLLYSYRAWIEAGPPEGRPEDDGGGGVDEDEDEPLHNVSDSERYILQQE